MTDETFLLLCSWLMPHPHTHVLPGKPQSVTSQECLNHFGDCGGGCLWALLLILRLALLPSSIFSHNICNFLSYLCNLHISSCKPQSTKLSWLICTHSAFLPFHGLSFQTMLRFFMLLSKPPWLSYSLQCCFYLFYTRPALPPSFINVPWFQLCMFKPHFSWQ